MFELTNNKIDSESFIQKYLTPNMGGIVTFEGRVRNHNEGKTVQSLEYEVFDSMALSEGQKVIDEAKEKFGVEHIYCIHRHGHLQIGDMAVWVGAFGKHRKEAFLACQYVIDRIKSEVPIWKKEYYTDSTSEWVNCAACAEHAHHHHYHDHEH